MPMFGKKKEDEMPLPPSPSSGALQDIKEEISSPPQPPMPSDSGATPAPQPPSLNAAPAIPMLSQEMGTPAPMPPQAAPPQQVMPSTEVKTPELNTAESDSLFNLDDFELPNLDDPELMNDVESLDDHDDQISSQHVAAASVPDSSASSVDYDVHVSKSRRLNVPKNDTFFLTTTEFKTLLDKVDQVKDRIKDSSQRHMKIMGIKAEEDIEIETMRKDFQFIEEKLYEIDSTIFDR